jgi:hypothetical protein
MSFAVISEEKISFLGFGSSRPANSADDYNK